MALLNYSVNESLERIYIALSGGADPSDVDGLLGQMPVNEALTRIAQLLEGSLGVATLTLPDAIPHGYGGIYVSTGTANQAFTLNTWAKVTGAFQNSMVGTDLTADYNDDRIVLNDVGTYFIEYRLSLLSSNGGNATLRARPYADSVAVPAAESSVVFSGSGSASISGFATLQVASANTEIDLRLYPSASINIKVASAQFYAHRELS